MNWNDIFDFASASDSESLTPSLPSSPCLSPVDTFERDFCSNFSCCGLALKDLHALLDHFEEHHVLVLARDGHPVYPALPPGAGPISADARAICASGTDTALVLSYPQPDPPAAPPSLDALERSRRAFDLHPSHNADWHDWYDSDAPSTLESSPAPSEPMCLPPALLSIHHPAHAPSKPKPKSKPPTKPKHASDASAEAKAQVLGTRRPERSPSQKRRPREKAFKCPRPGCSKEYLNPNGLKYHLEKGTCTVVSVPAFFPDTHQHDNPNLHSEPLHAPPPQMQMEAQQPAPQGQ